jgi:hypothetical protein
MTLRQTVEIICKMPTLLQLKLNLQSSQIHYNDIIIISNINYFEAYYFSNWKVIFHLFSRYC